MRHRKIDEKKESNKDNVYIIYACEAEWSFILFVRDFSVYT